jgi:hypothetical protein
MITSGVRLGTPASTTRGFSQKEFILKQIQTICPDEFRHANYDVETVLKATIWEFRSSVSKKTLLMPSRPPAHELCSAAMRKIGKGLDEKTRLRM